jgi:hypothetical protein
MWMLLYQVIRSLGSADETQPIDESRFHQWRHGGSTSAGDEMDSTWG